MPKSCLLVALVAFPFVAIQIGSASSFDSHVLNDSIRPVEVTAPASPVVGSPTHISIPSIGLDTNIENVGLTENGEMGVPDGNTNNVGWYQFGAAPGQTGSAVLDAHVFAAFTNLRYLKVGSDIYVDTSLGQRLHFVVGDSRVYKLSEVPLQTLFNKNDGQFLNLITCAGQVLPDGSTYDHRLVIYAQLVQD